MYENELRTFFSFTFENYLNLLWVYHFGNFVWKKSGKGAPISLLAPCSKNPWYTTVNTHADWLYHFGSRHTTYVPYGGNNYSYLCQ